MTIFLKRGLFKSHRPEELGSPWWEILLQYQENRVHLWQMKS